MLCGANLFGTTPPSKTHGKSWQAAECKGHFSRMLLGVFSVNVFHIMSPVTFVLSVSSNTNVVKAKLVIILLLT